MHNHQLQCQFFSGVGCQADYKYNLQCWHIECNAKSALCGIDSRPFYIPRGYSIFTVTSTEDQVLKFVTIEAHLFCYNADLPVLYVSDSPYNSCIDFAHYTIPVRSCF